VRLLQERRIKKSRAKAGRVEIKPCRSGWRNAGSGSASAG